MASKEIEEIRVVMFGKTGVGKSLLGNKILGQKKFVARTSAQSVTKLTIRGERKIDKDCKLVLVDTPGLFDTAINDNMETAKILSRTVKETTPGPHVFLFVLSISNRFTAEEQAAIEFLKDLFGKHVTEYLIIVFTRKDDLDNDNINLDTYIKNAGKDLKSLVSQCQGMMAINNRASDEEVTESVNSLLQMIKGVYLKNDKKHYTDELLQEAETIFQAKLDEQEEEAHRRERELEAENKKLGEEKDLITTKHETESKQYKLKCLEIEKELIKAKDDKVQKAELENQKLKMDNERLRLEQDFQRQFHINEKEVQRLEFENTQNKKRMEDMQNQMKNNDIALNHFKQKIEERPTTGRKCTIQ